MTRPESDLPDDVEALKAMVLAMAEKAARVEALEKQVDDLEARNADVDERLLTLNGRDIIPDVFGKAGVIVNLS